MNAEPTLERLARVEGRVDEHSRMVEDIAGRFTNLEAKFDRAEANANARFDRLESSFNTRIEHLESSVNARFERVDARFERVDARFERVDARFDSLDTKIDRVRGELDGKMTRYFTWMVGLVLTSWLSTMYQIARTVH